MDLHVLRDSDNGLCHGFELRRTDDTVRRRRERNVRSHYPARVHLKLSENDLYVSVLLTGGAIFFFLLNVI